MERIFLNAFKALSDRLRRFFAVLWAAFKTIDDEGRKAALRTIFRELGAMCAKLLRPKGTGMVSFGTGDPYDTARMMELAAFLYPAYGEAVEIVPIFDKAVIEGELHIKGKLRLSHIVFPLIRLMSDKDVRELFNASEKI